MGSAARAGVGKRDPGHERIVEDDHSFDQILQFADVAGVAVAREPLHHRGRNTESVAPVELRVALDEVTGQERDLGGALAERRHQHMDDVETIVEIFAESAFGHRTLQILVGRREDSNVHAQRRLRSNPRELAVLEDVEQLGLKRGMEVADLVEEDCSAVRRLELADLELVGAGEGTALVTEELALQELAWHGGAVDLHERPGPADGAVVDRACDQLLARPGLAGHEYGDIDAGGLPNDLASFQHLRTAPEFHLASNLPAQLLASRPGRFGLRSNKLIDRLLEFVEAQRLMQHCLDPDRGSLLTAVGDRDDGSGILAPEPQALYKLGDVGAVSAQIDHREGEMSVCERFLGFVR